MSKKPMKGHKLDYVRYRVDVICECGWESAGWCGKGARGAAYAEWETHKEKCLKARA